MTDRSNTCTHMRVSEAGHFQFGSERGRSGALIAGHTVLAVVRTQPF